MDGDYLWMSEAEIQEQIEQARKVNDAIRRADLARFKKDPMQFIRRLLDIGYTDNMINDIIKSF